MQKFVLYNTSNQNNTIQIKLETVLEKNCGCTAIEIIANILEGKEIALTKINESL